VRVISVGRVVSGYVCVQEHVSPLWRAIIPMASEASAMARFAVYLQLLKGGYQNPQTAATLSVCIACSWNDCIALGSHSSAITLHQAVNCRDAIDLWGCCAYITVEACHPRCFCIGHISGANIPSLALNTWSLVEQTCHLAVRELGFIGELLLAPLEDFDLRSRRRSKRIVESSSPLPCMMTHSTD
jgi:hypothetical protein